MKRNIFYLVFSGLLLLLTDSCERKIVPSLIMNKSGKNSKEAVFNYVYVEAIKQKLLG